MKATGWFLGCGSSLTLLTCLVGIILLTGGMPFNPGPLSAEHPQARPIANYTSHADFEKQCALCHAPFHGPDANLCNQCHTDVHDQIANAQGLHGKINNDLDCAACHTDHKGRAANLTSKSPENFAHNQFGFTLVNHQRDYNNVALACRSCHSFATTDTRTEKVAILAACVDCHKTKDSNFIAQHRREMGEACLACHDGTDRLKGFKHANVYPLTGKHAPVTCIKCHTNDRYRGTPKDCVSCHADPQVHRGQFGTNCAACHTVNGWTPARLIKHTFPFNHGNKGKDADCRVCHPANYATNTCYNCHEHKPDEMASIHLQANIRDYQNCTQCHATGKKRE